MYLPDDVGKLYFPGAKFLLLHFARLTYVTDLKSSTLAWDGQDRNKTLKRFTTHHRPNTRGVPQIKSVYLFYGTFVAGSKTIFMRGIMCRFGTLRRGMELLYVGPSIFANSPCVFFLSTFSMKKVQSLNSQVS